MGKGRAPCCDKTKVRTGPWSPTEDLRLMEFVLKNGHSNWRSLPKQAGLLRCGKSCRLRWVNYLRPDVKRGHFTAQEEETIIKLYNSFGKKWSKIASYLPGRTDNEIKNVWNTHLKKRVMNMKNNIGEDGQGINSEMDISGVSSSRDENTDILFSSVQESSLKLTSINPSDHHNEPKQTAVSNFDNFSPEKAVGYSESDNATYPQGDSSDNGIIEIPSDYDFWELLDSLEPLQLINKTAYNGSGSGSGEQDSNITLTDRASFDGEDSVGKWLRSLEDELGLTREYDADHLHMDQNRVTASPPYQEMNNFETPEISLAFDYYSIWPCSPQYHDI